MMRGDESCCVGNSFKVIECGNILPGDRIIQDPTLAKHVDAAQP